MADIKLVKNLRISGKIECRTGLHVGGISDASQIGGVDSPVVVSSRNGMPYIPGSSIKGKMRSLLELKSGIYEKNEKIRGSTHSCNEANCLMCKIFGRPAGDSMGEEAVGPTRLIVADADPTPDTVAGWEKNDRLSHGTEIKAENTINRLTSMANPRFMERVPSGSEFSYEILLSVYESDDEKAMLNYLVDGMRLLQDSYLGGYGSRGSGKIVFRDSIIAEKRAEDYSSGDNKWKNEKSFEV